MLELIKIELNQLHFFAYHGLYAEEKKIGAEFEVSLEVSFPPADKITALDETVNYEKLYLLLKKEMQKPRDLLETLAMEIVQAMHLSFSQIKKIDIVITKLQVPVIGFTGNVGVRYIKEY
ncbi:MAG: dihydroneopterin aldolase [Chitinophagales bacterium]